MRGVTLTTSTLILLVVLATALATTIGVVAGNALGSTGNPNAATQTSGTGGTSSTTTTTTLPPALASGPDQSHAPAIPTGGGGQPGYGNFNAVACANATRCLAVGTDDQGNGVASFSADGGTSWDSSSLPTVSRCSTPCRAATVHTAWQLDKGRSS